MASTSTSPTSAAAAAAAGAAAGAAAAAAASHALARFGLRGKRALVTGGTKGIGRVITTQAARGTGMGRELMGEALRRCAALWPGEAVRIGAQTRGVELKNNSIKGFAKETDVGKR